MSFIWPLMFVLLILIPLFVVLYLRLQRRRRRVAATYGRLGLVSGTPGARRHIPIILFLIGLTILIVALARPQTVVSLPRIEGTVILAFDVSGSMAADDFQPTRMEAAKAAARDFIAQQPPDVQIGVVSFSESGFSVQAPTNDPGPVLAAINRLAPQRGTSLAYGILTSLKAIQIAEAGPKPQFYSNLTPTPEGEAAPTPTPVPPGTHTSSVIVLLTDGENNTSPDPLVAAQTAADQGVRIYTIGIGSAAGSILHIEGLTIRSKLNEDLLQQIAQITDGTYYNAATTQDLQAIYHNLDPQLVIKPEKTEITALFAGVGIVLLLIGGVLSLLWFSRLP
ncbi:MAG TPA: VWA domain-containing protein [Anaerolineae bacterium]|nr:VWA domain-containing protein [Anaerolineae bacterium]